MSTSGSGSSNREPSPGALEDRSGRPRSCFACYGRKVRCDKNLPCASCVRMNSRCVYPEPEGDTRNPRDQRRMIVEVIDRLDRLEDLITNLVHDDKPVTKHSVSPSKSGKRLAASEEELTASGKRCKTIESCGDMARESWEVLVGNNGSDRRYLNDPILENVLEDVSLTFFLSPFLWSWERDADIYPLTCSMQGERSTAFQDISFTRQSARSNISIRLASGLFPSPCDRHNMNYRCLLPDSTMAIKLWRVYVRNVDPVSKILHLPSTQISLIDSIADHDSASGSLHALFFAIYFGAVTSLRSDEVTRLFEGDRFQLLGRFEQGLDEAFQEADMLNCPTVTTLQAFAIYLVCHILSSS